MAFLHLLESIRTPVLDTLFQLITIFGEEISGREWLGIILIIAAVSVVVAAGSKNKNK